MEKMNLNSSNPKCPVCAFNHVIDIAKFVLSKIFECDPIDISTPRDRSKNTVVARRFFIYYLCKVKYVPFNHIKKYINSKANHHATAMYHCKIMTNELSIYRGIELKWMTFLFHADRDEFDKLPKEKKDAFTNFKKYNNYKIK